MNVWKMNFKDNQDELIFAKILKHILKYKRIYLSVFLSVGILLTIIVLTVNNINNKREKEIKKSLANRTFVNFEYFSMLEFNDNGKCDYSSIDVNDEETLITNVYDEITDFCEYDIEINLWGKKFIYCDGEYNLITDKNNNVISFGRYYPINEEFKKMLDDYYLKLEQEKKEKEEIEQIKGYLPDKNEFYERVLKIFPEVKKWQLYGNTEGLYMDPYNSKNYFNVSEKPMLIFNNGNNRIAFFRTETGLMISANGGNRLTSERYEQLIKLAFGDASDNLKICDLATFKKLTNTEGKAYPTKHTIEYKGITYEWNVGYKNGEQNSYIFSIAY